MDGPVILIPIRSFAEGKTRLAPALDGGERKALVRAMATRAIDAVDASSARVVTGDDEVARWARALGVAVFADRGGGLNVALEEARATARDDGATTVAVLFADLPQVTADDVADLMNLDAEAVVAGDHTGTGTNALHIPAA